MNLNVLPNVLFNLVFIDISIVYPTLKMSTDMRVDETFDFGGMFSKTMPHLLPLNTKKLSQNIINTKSSKSSRKFRTYQKHYYLKFISNNYPLIAGVASKLQKRKIKSTQTPYKVIALK